VSTATTIAVTPALLREWPLPLPSEGKESRGHVLVVAGSIRTPGAALLASEACLRAGAGKLTIATTSETAPHLAVAVPESLVEPLPATPGGHLDATAADAICDLAAQADAVLIGTGMLDNEATLELMAAVAPRLTVPAVVDATATAYLRERRDGFRHLAKRVVVTANPSEIAHVAKREIPVVEEDPIATCAETAESCGVVVLLGGTDKLVADPDGSRWAYAGGGPGLGVSGSGDVQAGIVAGLVARGAEPAQAAVWGAFVHARAGERLAAESGVLGHLAREQTAHVPLVLRELG
jgi:hydroxyethylthiazole kinase-like uncharacterized protein yjeF